MGHPNLNIRPGAQGPIADTDEGPRGRGPRVWHPQARQALSGQATFPSVEVEVVDEARDMQSVDYGASPWRRVPVHVYCDGGDVDQVRDQRPRQWEWVWACESALALVLGVDAMYACSRRSA